MNWKQYSAMAAAFLAMKNRSDAQIIYTDVPDTAIYPAVFTGNHYALDLNNDGQVDFNFEFWKYSAAATSSFIRSFSLYGYQQFGNHIEGTDNNAAALHENDVIDANRPWISHSAVMGQFHSTISSLSATGNWINVTNRYLGLRLIENTDTLYGWLRMDVNIQDSMVIKDFAYNTIPGEQILAGEIDTAVYAFMPENGADPVTFPNPVSTHIHISMSKSSFQETVVSLFDLSGKRILSETLSFPTGQIDVSRLPEGFYLLVLKNRDAVLTKEFEIIR